MKFRRQHPVAETTYVADFLCYHPPIIIEVDGGIHLNQQEADAERQAILESLGYRVLRFQNKQIFHNLHAVLTQILETAGRLIPDTNPSVGSNFPSP